MNGFKSERLAIIGLGLMGGSLALALRDKTDHIIGMDLNPDSAKYALEHGIIDSMTTDLKTAVNEADTVILAAPVRVILKLLQQEIGTYLRSNTLVIDLGSTKADICEALGRLPIGVQAIGGHPMTGKERSGVEESDATLYHNRPFVLCETRRTTPATRHRALSFVEALGAIAIEMEAHRHDRVVATISHVPYLLSIALMATASRQAEHDEGVWALAAGGFRDMTRLSGSDITMMSDITSTNTQAIAELLAHFRMQLAILETHLIAGDKQGLVETLKPQRDARLNWEKFYKK
jgi:prephenate dehydrogenase